MQSYVYAGAERIGEQTVSGNSATSGWRYVDPVTGDEGNTVLDPQGVDVGLEDPFPPDGSGDPSLLLNGGEPLRGTARPLPIEGGGAQCVIDGIRMDCAFIRGETSVQCPNNDCGPSVWEKHAGDANGPLVGYALGSSFRPTVGGGPAFLPPGVSHLENAVAGGRVNSAWTNGYSTLVWTCDSTGNCYKVPTAYSGSEYFESYTGDPQDSVVPLPGDLRDRVAARVNNPKSDCADFMKRLIAEAARIDGKAFNYGSDLMNLSDRVQNGGGFNLRQQVDKGNAGFDSRGRPAVYIKPVSTSNDPRRIDNVQTNYAGTALNEIMHLAKNSGFYDDPVMARALFNILSPDEQKANPRPNSNARDPNSRYWHPLFLEHCQP